MDAEKPRNRGENGKFLPGNNANPTGRPKVVLDFMAKCRRYAEAKGWENIRAIADDPNHHEHLKANEVIFAYAYGKPAQQVKLSGDGDSPLVISIIEVNRLPKP